MRRSHAVALAGLVVVLVVAAFIVRIHSGSRPRAAANSQVARSAQPSAPISSPAVPALTATQSRTLFSEMTSGSQHLVLDAVAMPLGSQVPAAAVASLAAQRPVTGDVTHFTETSATTASMPASTGTGRQWVVHLIWRGGRWQIFDTVPR